MVDAANWPDGLSDRSDLEFPAIKKSRGSRKVAARSKGSVKGGLVCPVTDRMIETDSNIEHNAVVHAYSDRNVRTVRTQAARIDYRTPEDVEASHHLDVVAETYGGLKAGLVVKHSSKAAKMRLTDFVAHLAEWTPASVADTLAPLTDRDLPEWHVRNCQHFLSVRADQRGAFDDLVREHAHEVVEPTPIRDFTARFGGGEFAFRPVMRAIFWGTFEVMTEGLIDADTVIQFSGEVMPDLDQERRYPLPVRFGKDNK
ncbi:hypothetical protein [Paradevosia shaoguanensis]|uniref:hypothetical protein n=1 Tax=Paradevosia shaoguanensis TaxID=1335043 RepID=UPI00193471DE|nr:hypothetical protein [Paradevosia shaoguanensis]